MIISRVCSPSSSDELPPTTSNLLIRKIAKISSIQTYINDSNLFGLQYVQCHTTDPQCPSRTLPPQCIAHPSQNTPQTTSPGCRARLRHTLACHASLRKYTMRRETFISIRTHIVSAHFSMLPIIIAQAQTSASREFPPTTSSHSL